LTPEENNASHLKLGLKPSKAPLIGVMRLSALGDVTNALAAVSSIRAHFKESRIVWFVGKIEHQLLKDIEGLEFEVINKKNPFKEFSRLKKKYKNTEFDILLHMQRSLRCSLMVKALKSKKTIGFDATRARELQWLFTSEQISEPKSPHAVDVFMEFAFKAGVPNDQRPVWNFGAFNSTSEVQSALNLKDLNLGEKESYLAIVACGSQKDRAWSASNNAEIIDWVLEHTKYKVCLLGGPSDFEKKHALEIIEHSQLKTEDRLINLVGRTDLKMLKSIIKHAKALVSPDTGPVHISSALGTPTVGLYVHMPKEITGPYNHLSLAVDKYKEALKLYYNKDAPETYLGIPKRIKDKPEAINLISSSEVVDKLKKALKEDL